MFSFIFEHDRTCHVLARRYSDWREFEWRWSLNRKNRRSCRRATGDFTTCLTMRRSRQNNLAKYPLVGYQIFTANISRRPGLTIPTKDALPSTDDTRNIRSNLRCSKPSFLNGLLSCGRFHEQFTGGILMDSG